MSAPDACDDDLPSRTGLAEDRTILAHERTFASWMRTSLGCIGIGLGFQGLFAAVHPAWVPKAIATAFLLLAVLLLFLAERRATAVLRQLSTHAVQASGAVNLRLFAILTSLGALALVAAIWLLELGGYLAAS